MGEHLFQSSTQGQKNFSNHFQILKYAIENFGEKISLIKSFRLRNKINFSVEILFYRLTLLKNGRGGIFNILTQCVVPADDRSLTYWVFLYLAALWMSQYVLSPSPLNKIVIPSNLLYTRWFLVGATKVYDQIYCGNVRK